MHYSLDSFAYLTRDAFVLRNRIRIQIAGIDPNAEPVGESPTAAVYNFYQGNNRSQWLSNAHLFRTVKLNNIYPGVSAVFSTSSIPVSTGSIGQGAVIFSIAPGIDPGIIRLRVLNTGANPFEGPDGIWFTGGNIPGVFIVSPRATQVDGTARLPTSCRLKIESSDTLSIQMPDRNPALAADVQIIFPDYELRVGQLQHLPPIFASSINYPSSFGEDGTLAVSNCLNSCTDAVVARVDDKGNPVWVTVFGGSRDESAQFATATKAGISVSGVTGSGDFPVTANAPYPALGGANDAFLALFDLVSGQLRNATFAGFQGLTGVLQQAAESGSDIALCGAHSDGAGNEGFALRWRPSENRLLYVLRFQAPVWNVAFDANSNLYFASRLNTEAILTGAVDGAGKPLGLAVRIDAPPGTQVAPNQLVAAGSGEFWAVYERRTSQPSAFPVTYAARISVLRGQILVNHRVANRGILADAELTPSGNLKLLVRFATETETTTPDAQLVAACRDTFYFAIFSPAGQLVYGSYVPNSGFDFTARNEAGAPPAPAVACFASTAGRFPTDFAAPGQLITVTGGGFGPLNPIYTSPDAGGKYPFSAGGFRVSIAGMNVPVFAVARGLITVQVPYETAPSLTLEVFENDKPLNSIPFQLATHVFQLFDTGDRNNSTGLPALVALNEDGTVNSAQNPAAAGSVVSLFGTGLGTLSPPLKTGELSPVPPEALLSESRLLRACWACEVLYLGSAPGLSTAIVQANVRIPADAPGSGVRPHGIGLVVGGTIRDLIIFAPHGIVFIQ